MSDAVRKDKEPAVFLHAIERRYRQGAATLEILKAAELAVWLTALVSLAAIEVFFPQVYGGNLMTVAIVLALLSCYLALALLSAREHLH